MNTNCLKGPTGRGWNAVNISQLYEKIQDILADLKLQSGGNITEVPSLLDVNFRGHIVHTVSQCFQMGKGFAKKIKKNIGRVQELVAQKKNVGDFAMLNENGRLVFYLIIKQKFYHKPNPQDLECALQKLRCYCEENEIKALHMPKLCGVDNLSWDYTVKPMLLRIFGHTNVQLSVYSPTLCMRPTMWNEENLRGLVIRRIEAHRNRGYEQAIREKFGDWDKFKKHVLKGQGLPTNIELRAMAEYFYFSCGINQNGGKIVRVGCGSAPALKIVFSLGQNNRAYIQ